MSTTAAVETKERGFVKSAAARILIGVVLSAFSGVMLLLSFPPYGIWWLAWFAFVPGIFAQYRFFPRKYSSLGPAIYLLVWLGPDIGDVLPVRAEPRV